ncbi:MAG: DNA adenine methylase, partial [Myxococcaceae bacterium]
MNLPHPIPYQGSKRALAPRILAAVVGQSFRTLHEPFAGSAALTLAAAKAQLARRFQLADSLEPLVMLWRAILEDADALADRYEMLWKGQRPEDDRYFGAVRDAFN